MASDEQAGPVQPAAASAPASKAVSHDATASLLGYVHQVRWGFLELLRSRTTEPDRVLSLEMHDDIAWENATSVTDLKQVKLHAKEVRSLGDSSPDLWRTIGVWLDHGRPADSHGPALTLITNSVATEGSAAGLLRSDSLKRDPEVALERLEAVAGAEGNKDTRKVRAKFMSLEPSERATFVGRMFVADGSADMEMVDAEVADRLAPGAPTEHFDTYLDQVWGWWNRTALAMLKKTRGPIDVPETLHALERIRNQFTTKNLPPLVDVEEIDDEMRASHDDSPFVHQLRWIGLADQPRQLQKAIVDYQRAFLQETRWLDRHLVDHDELDRFTDSLIDEWEREFDYMCGDLPSTASEDDKRKAGRKLLRDLGNSDLRIRTDFREPFHARGRRHGLADAQTIGWHPDFTAHLETLLLGSEPEPEPTTV